MKKSLILATVMCVVLCCGLVAVWSVVYSEQGDPKNIKYVLWKKGLYPLDPDIALETMMGDRGGEKLVLGKSKEQLARRFEFLTPIEQASEYDRRAAAEMHICGGSEVFALRKSAWLVVFSQGKASKLILVKGF